MPTLLQRRVIRHGAGWQLQTYDVCSCQHCDKPKHWRIIAETELPSMAKGFRRAAKIHNLTLTP